MASAACAFRTPDAPETPDLWDSLRKSVDRKRSKDGRKLHINDSKAVYTPAAGLAELERAVLCLTEQAVGPTAGLDDWLGKVDPDVVPMLAGYPWYAKPANEPWPGTVSPAAFRIAYNGYSACSAAAATACVHYRVRLLPERQYNDHTAKTKNKASTLFTLAAQHLDDLLRLFSDQNLLIVCDRQGGRSHYGPLLRLMFEDWNLVILDESDAKSAYELTTGQRKATIIFREKAEASCLPVAAASMLAKYARESLMGRFNRYWQAQQPGLKPTAGYYTDGMRFLEDIAALRRQLGVDDLDLIRQR
ncbi:MAG: hypothetical protein QM754_06760 [Tepidisphaeraceae bacterium]